MIKILMDPQIFQAQKFGGISRYCTEILNELTKRANVQIDCPILYTENIHYKESALFEKSYQNRYALLIRFSKIFRPFLPRKLKRKSQQNFKELLQKQQFDVFVPTYYDPEFLTYAPNKPFVLTVHDMIHELFPQHFTNDPHTSINKKILIEKAARIITVSENTKKDLLKIYPNTDPSKIDVVYLAYTLKKNQHKKLKLPENYILFVGNRDLYKNFTFFLKAISNILKNTPDLKLLCAGGNSFDEEELRLINHLKISSQVIQQNFEDSELVSYYKNALCFVFPSEYEGFGIPVLEAMASGCPVVLPNYSSFPEVAGEAGVYFELNNADDLNHKITHLISNPSIRKEYHEKGLLQAQKFTWKKTVEACLNVYQKTINTL